MRRVASFSTRRRSAFADGGDVRAPRENELILAPPGTVPVMLPGRSPLLSDYSVATKHVALGALLPAGYTRLLLPAFRAKSNAPTLPLFGYSYACAIEDPQTGEEELYVAAMQTDARDDWSPRTFAVGELEALVEKRRAEDPSNGRPRAARHLLALVRLLHSAKCFPRTR